MLPGPSPGVNMAVHSLRAAALALPADTPPLQEHLPGGAQTWVEPAADTAEGPGQGFGPGRPAEKRELDFSPRRAGPTEKGHLKQAHPTSEQWAPEAVQKIEPALQVARRRSAQLMVPPTRPGMHHFQPPAKIPRRQGIGPGQPTQGQAPPQGP